MTSPSRALAHATVGAIAAVVLAACGGGESDAQSASEPSGEPTAGDASSPSTASPDEDNQEAPAAPTYRVLGEPGLTKALLGVQDVPPGYSQDPPVPNGPNKTFCDYKPPHTEKVYVSRDFTKGGGLSSELLRVGLRQYANPEQALEAFEALTTALETCTGETYQGSELTYAPMSAAKVGDASVGVKITTDEVTLLQNFALVGPTLVNTGGGGLMNANADEVTSLLEAQVEAYETAARQ